MFMLATREDILPVSPKLFQLDLETVVKVLINKKYANHVIQNVGLAICLYDLISLDESCIYQGEGDAYTRVRFRLIGRDYKRPRQRWHQRLFRLF